MGIRTLPPGIIRSEIEKAGDELRAVGVEPRMFRPPGGSTSAEVQTIAREKALRDRYLQTVR